MKKIINLVTLRVGIATTLCLSFVIYPQLRVSSARITANRGAADLKSESQFRSEAARYDAAIRAIAGIGTMKLETGEDLKKAIAILKRESPNLKFQLSRFVVTALDDRTFTAAAKRKAPDKQAVEAFAKELGADPKAIFKVGGADSLKTRLSQSSQSDSALLRKVGTRLKEAAERIRRANQSTGRFFGVQEDLKVMRVSFADHRHAARAEASDIAAAPSFLIIPLITYAIVVAAVLFYTVVVADLVGLTTAIGNVAENFGSEERRDEVAECQEKADDRYLTCVAEANRLPSGPLFFEREVAQGLCYAAWLAAQADCLLLYL